MTHPPPKLEMALFLPKFGMHSLHVYVQSRVTVPTHLVQCPCGTVLCLTPSGNGSPVWSHCSTYVYLFRF